ncbi:hypothetical protein Phi19:1_gp008 [Cellulophaga phage phi19:1]|uniref:Uncharacterized protein n=2 Tax=Assiduviridae TaxID=2946156 RepID=S0A294_9CAUD|nr:hypothetical protein Phi19:1_gp008 [Cellulophaga phage phi19:1]YP_008241921.1 hypothetical protein Phi10:1_gp002 [Cellulophaga phage phi10:1]AGO47298.1 hypothetical protein Phi19:1_gp008 [Cellulophaga phage phi19:1]AGO48343.1 hypothetical protein Phi10:1_gp002 [Cellulophaga phage phi10:1]
MDFKIKCKEVENREDFFDLEISTYKDTIKGRFEMSEIRHMIAILDNAINVGI